MTLKEVENESVVFALNLVVSVNRTSVLAWHVIQVVTLALTNLVTTDTLKLSK